MNLTRHLRETAACNDSAEVALNLDVPAAVKRAPESSNHLSDSQATAPQVAAA